MYQRILSLAVVLLTAAVLVSGTVRAQPLDPAAVIDAYTAAINAHDVEGALAFVDDNAVYMRPSGQFIGREEVRGFIAGLVAQNVQIELLGERQEFGNYVMWMSQVTLSDPSNPDAAPMVLHNQSESIVHDGHIVFHMATRVPVAP
jgi:ketosteroid isomerase-like protein